MNSRQRVELALNHKEPDRVPLDLGSTEVTSISIQAYRDIRRFWGMEEKEPTLGSIVQQLAIPDEDFLQRIGCDFRPVVANPPSTWKFERIDEDDYWAFIDEWGAKLRMPKKNGFYYDYVEFPFKEPTFNALKKFKFPDPDDPARIKGLKEKAKHLYESTDYALVGSCLFGGGIFEHPARIRGMENFLMDLAGNIKFADALMEEITQRYIQMYSNFLDEVGPYLSVVTYWDDVTGQTGSLISPQMYRRYVKPKQKRIVDAIKRKTSAKIFLHCCGACFSFIPDFIEIGFDIINPVQVSAVGMDTVRLKRDFGDDIVFWGGIDTQKILPFGIPQDVEKEVKRRIEDLAPGGGYVLNSVHNIQAGISPENLSALFTAFKKYAEY